MNILLVDDEEDIAEELSDVLRRRGHRVVTAPSVTEACLSLMRDGPFDLVITDLRLPAGTGVDIVRACARDVGRRPKMVVMTGETDAKALDDEAITRSVSKVLLKPFSRRQFLDAVHVAA